MRGLAGLRHVFQLFRAQADAATARAAVEREAAVAAVRCRCSFGMRARKSVQALASAPAMPVVRCAAYVRKHVCCSCAQSCLLIVCTNMPAASVRECVYVRCLVGGVIGVGL